MQIACIQYLLTADGIIMMWDEVYTGALLCIFIT